MSEPQALVDAHAHLCDPVFDADREAVLERAREAGVGAVVAVGESVEDARRNLDLAAQFPDMVRPTAGLYPTILDPRQAEQMEDLIRRHRSQLVAIGEVGLDRWKVREEDELELQQRIFERFIDLSLELDLPLNVHSRSAGQRTLSVLIERGARRVLMHAFDGRAAKALTGVEAGFFFSVPPSVVRSRQKRKLVARLPLDCLLLETDSPVLGPVAQQRNEPANVRISLREIADIKGIPEEDVEAAVIENTVRLFGELT